MGEWTEKTWGEVLTLQRGFDITKKEQDQDGKVPVVSSGGISSYHNEFTSDGPGVVMGRKGTLGRVYYLAGPFWAHDTTLWVKDFKGNHPRFVYYALQSIDPKNLDVGSASPTLNRNHVHPIPVRWPNRRTTQRAIAEVLGALDDKIAANEQAVSTIQTLADAEFIRAAGGTNLTPSTFETVAEVGGGGTPKTSVPEFWEGAISWATPTDITKLPAPYLSSTSRTITPEGLASCSSPLYPQGSILMTSRATIGAFAVAQGPLAVNQGFIVVNAKSPRLQWWLFHDMKSRVSEFVSYANGATFLELPRRRFRDLAVAVPDDSAAEAFANRVGPLHAASAQLLTESQTLATTRDQLLPLLMSGKITVKDAEDRVADAL